MAKERLSKLQKFILIYLYKKSKENLHDKVYQRWGIDYKCVLFQLAIEMKRYFGEVGEEVWIDVGFRPIFCKSIRNLALKDLIYVQCTHEFYKDVKATGKRHAPLLDRERVKAQGMWISEKGIEKLKSLKLTTDINNKK